MQSLFQPFVEMFALCGYGVHRNSRGVVGYTAVASLARLCRVSKATAGS